MSDEWQLRYVRVPKGTHLSESRASEGVERDLLRQDGTNKLLGPTESFPADEDALHGAHSDDINSRSGSSAAEPSFGDQVIAAAVANVVDALVDAIDWDAVFDKAAVALKRTKGRIVERFQSALGRADNRSGMEVVATADIPEDPPEKATPAVKGPEFRMSSAEYRERAKAILVADAYAAWQREMLSNAFVDDDETSPELLSAVTLVLEGRTSSLDEAELAAVMEYLKGPQAADGAYVLPRGEASGETTKPITGD